MNLPNTTNGMAGGKKIAVAASGFFRQIRDHGIVSARLKMQILDRAGKPATLLALTVFCLALTSASAQTNYYSANGAEYAIVGALPGDQVSPDVAISTNGGYLVWADNVTDGSSWGIRASKLDSTLSGTLGTFRVNVDGNGPQENPHVALLPNGGAVFVWQGGKQGFQHIYARFLDSNGTFLGGADTLVNSATNNYQLSPAVTVLPNGNVVIVWQSFNQAGVNTMADIYGQIFTSTGTNIGSEFLVNQFTAYNQRAAAVAAQPNGGFIVTWVSEQQRVIAPALGSGGGQVSFSTISVPSTDIYARYYNATGSPLANEFLVNTDNKPCANPSLAVAADGSYLFTWTARDLSNVTNGLDIYARPYNNAGIGGSVVYVNSRIYGDEFVSKVSAIGQDFLITWTSLGQDGSREGVYGRHLHNNGAYNSGEFLINTTTVSQQMNPCVASDGNSQFIVAWRSFTGIANGFDLYAQRYLNMQVGLPAMSAPYVWAPFVVSSNVYQPRLVITWAPLMGISVANYEVYVNGSSTASAIVTSNQWVMTSANGLAASTTNSFRVDYVTTDGRRSPISPAGIGATWSMAGSWGGIPFDWMKIYYGDLVFSFVNGVPTYNWPPPDKAAIAGGMILSDIFLSGGSPLNSNSWLKQTLTRTVQGFFLNWNTTPGATYQVWVKTNLTSPWSNYGAPRFASGGVDSINVGGGSASYFQIQLLR